MDSNLYSTKKINQNHILLNENEMKKISFLKTPSTIFGIFKIPKKIEEVDSEGTIIALDSIKDPR